MGVYEVKHFSENAPVQNRWAVYYRPDKVSQPWSILCSYDNKVGAIIRAYQVSALYFMIEVLDPNGRIIWSS